MGRYSRKDMIEFAKFAKSYQSSRSVEEAYDDYLMGVRLIPPNNNTPSWYMLFMGANIVYADDKLVKVRYTSDEPVHGFNIQENRYRKKSWDKDRRILHLIRIQ